MKQFFWFLSALGVWALMGCSVPSEAEHVVVHELKDGKKVTIPVEMNPPQMANLTMQRATLLPQEAASPQATDATLASTKQALSSPNYGVSTYIRRGESRWFSLDVQAGQTYHLAIKPSYGDPDLSLYRWSGSAWTVVASSVKGPMKMDRLRYVASRTERLWVLLYGYSEAGLTYSASWEVGGKLMLDVPFLNQNTLPNIGFAACSSTSSVMVLAAHGKIAVDQMSSEAPKIFAATADLNVGLKGRDGLEKHLEANYGMSVRFDASSWAPLYALIQSEIRAGRPLVLGSRSMSSAGHYIVVVGFNGHDYNSAKLLVNDPNGAWSGWNRWSTSARGDGLEYSYKTITSKSSDGVFVLLP